MTYQECVQDMKTWEFTEEDLEWVILRDGRVYTDGVASEERVLELIGEYDKTFPGFSFSYRRMKLNEMYPENLISSSQFKPKETEE